MYARCLTQFVCHSGSWHEREENFLTFFLSDAGPICLHRPAKRRERTRKTMVRWEVEDPYPSGRDTYTKSQINPSPKWVYFRAQRILPARSECCFFFVPTAKTRNIFYYLLKKNLAVVFLTRPFSIFQGLEEKVRYVVRRRKDHLPSVAPRLHGQCARQGDTSSVRHRQG